MPGLLGKKIGMTSVFSAEGKNVPCTVIEAGPCVVTQVKTVEKDGYAAVQLGFQDKKEKHTTKPLMGHFKRAGVTPKRHLAEFKEFETELNLGDTVTVELFNDATFVDVVGTSKGKGFQDVIFLPVSSPLMLYTLTSIISQLLRLNLCNQEQIP